MMPIELITAVLVAAPPINDDWMDALDLQEGGILSLLTLSSHNLNITTDVNQCQNTYLPVPLMSGISSPLEKPDCFKRGC